MMLKNPKKNHCSKIIKKKTRIGVEIPRIFSSIPPGNERITKMIILRSFTVDNFLFIIEYVGADPPAATKKKKRMHRILWQGAAVSFCIKILPILKN